MKTDIEIAREIKLKPIQDIAQGLGIDNADVEPYGHHIAKVGLSSLRPEKIAKSNLILVTAITPNKAGVGKTTVSIGLALGLNHIGKRAIVALREPSLGPCFGQKGCCRGGICPGTTNGKYQPPLHRRLPCHHLGTQYDYSSAR